MKTAIIYTSKHGTTEKVAHLIAQELQPLSPDLFNLRTKPAIDLTSYDNIIIGTPVYAGNPPAAIRTFCNRYRAEWSGKKTGLFVCGLEADPIKREQETQAAFPQELRQEATAVCFLGGELIFGRLNFFERFLMKRIMKTGSDLSRIDDTALKQFAALFRRP